MISFYLAILVGGICTYVAGYPQFYYMVPSPVQSVPASTYYSSSFGNNPTYQFGPPATTSFASNSFGPSQAYYTTHQTFGSLGGSAAPLPYQTFIGNTPNGIVQTQQHSAPRFQQPEAAYAQIPTAAVFSTGPTDQFRGFAYHTQSTNGASANVFFVTGPEAHQIQNLQTFAIKNIHNGTESKPIQKAKTLASDTVDSNATDKNQQQQIVETLAAPPQGPAFDALRSFLSNPQIGFQNFYSGNGQLFTRPLGDNSVNFPASTFLLPASTSIQTFGNFPLQPLNATETNATSKITEKEKSEDSEEDVAESMVTDVIAKPTEATTDDTSSTPETSTASTVTELSTTEETATKDAPTVKEARSIKQESNTKKEDKTETSTAKIESSSVISEVSSTTKKV